MQLPPINKQRVARLAHHLLTHGQNDSLLTLDNGRTFGFDMKDYAKNRQGKTLLPDRVKSCGTSCCFMGYAPLVFPETRNMTRWFDVGNWILGGREGYYLLFSSEWPNNPKHAACRALFLLEYGSYYDDGEFDGDVTGGRMELENEAILAELETYF